AWTIDTQAEWEQSLGSQAQLVLKDGMASPTAKMATFQSVVKSFSKKRSAQSITFEQSPAWLNWEPTPNLGTKSMSDAPVFLSLGPDNYWMFARYNQSAGKKNKPAKMVKKGKPAAPVEPAKAEPAFVAEAATLEGFDIPLLTTRLPNEFKAPGGLKKSMGGYHAWQSRDMKNWVHHGSITENFSRWMTTAEYVDGKAYFYYDFPNDQDPHVYVDDNLTDGTPGKNMGMAFKDPSHGSDCAFIRDLEGNFHVIYEDWSPINAKTHAWDSPLAGHAVSPNGLNDFKILAPAVDERTSPTGKIGTYNHPHWAKEDPDNYKTSVAEYEIHEPEQNAYGDWASISIGGQYYLFADFDPAGKHGSGSMSVGMFTSSSLDEPFTFFNNVGKGHPDPDICFAEGRFYLATQQNSDFTSPGPWVETVEVRVGVDTDKDAKIDQWSDWQVVAESYDYTPGFAKQIQKISAAMDLSGLPEGYGFQFEVRMADTTENKSKPVLDKVVLSFAK
ncbi:MAG: hypothetical protein ACN4GF_06770, partial [Lentimonas sp.]